MVVFLIVMKLLFVICEALLKKKTTVLFPTINLQSEVEECAIATLYDESARMIHLT